MVKRLNRWVNQPSHRLLAWTLIFTVGVPIIAVAGYSLARYIGWSDPLNRTFASWGRSDQSQREALVTAQHNACPSAPFILPTEGFIGLLYADPRGPYSRSRPHQGIDIFSNSEPGVTPVLAAYDGYVTREPEWRSSIVLRVPDDPLQEGRQIWLYYTHMADAEGNDFIEGFIPPGTRELFVQ